MHKFLDPMPRVVAHRGDSINYPENTLPAFMSAAKLGVDIIETDIHLTKDNKIVIHHDPTIDGVCKETGAIVDYTLAELKSFDVAYRFTKDGGKTYPFRGQGISIATLEEALIALPNQRFNVDLKDKTEVIVDEFIKVLTNNNALDRVVGASFHKTNLVSLRKKEPRILTSLATGEVAPLLFLQKLGILPKKFKRQMLFQIPVRLYGIQILTPRFIKAMHKRDAIIMIWTVNEQEEMKRLYDMNVDAVMTDDPYTLTKVAKEYFK